MIGVDLAACKLGGAPRDAAPFGVTAGNYVFFVMSSGIVAAAFRTMNGYPYS